MDDRREPREWSGRKLSFTTTNWQRKLAAARRYDRVKIGEASIQGRCIVCGETFTYIPSMPGFVREHCGIRCKIKASEANRYG